MGFGDKKVTRNTHASVIDMRSPYKLRGCDLDDRTSGEEGFRIHEEIYDASAFAAPLSEHDDSPPHLLAFERYHEISVPVVADHIECRIVSSRSRFCF